ncbi:MAG: FHA domain-containing protein [Coriobacteriia bacterium]|nr:FHA domain-containing protein [Coriobacteriia bacterium]
MEAALVCPACGEAVEAGSETCAKCGANLVGQTESFDPLELSAGEITYSLEAHGNLQLTITKGPYKGGVFYLEEFPVTIGRDTECDIFLNNRTVSRQHAIIERQGDRVVVRDNHSLNGTWVNEKIVDEAELHDGAILQIGTFFMRFNC